MREIPLAAFVQLYEDGLLSEALTAKDRVYARNVKGQADNPRQYEIVWARLP